MKTFQILQVCYKHTMHNCAKYEESTWKIRLFVSVIYVIVLFSVETLRKKQKSRFVL